MKTAECIGRFDLIRPGERVLCALSGGADSVCMTHALALLREKGDFSLAAAHFSHGIRPADADRERAKKYQAAMEILAGKQEG